MCAKKKGGRKRKTPELTEDALGLIPVKTREALGTAQESAYLIMTKAWSVFEEKAPDCEVGSVIISKENFSECGIKYAKDTEDGAYVVSVFLKKPLIITLRVGHGDMELVFSDKKGKIREFISQKDGVLERM